MFRHSLHGLLSGLFMLAALSGRAEPDLPADQAYAAAQAGKLKLLDIRTPQEWRDTGVAPAAGRVDFYGGPQALLQALTQLTGGDKTVPVALICHVGVRTTYAQEFLQAQGYTQIYNIKEGMAGSASGPGWLRRGLPVEHCAPC